MIRFQCPSCGRKIKTPLDLAGKEILCPGCKLGVDVPDPASQHTTLVTSATDDTGDSQKPPPAYCVGCSKKLKNLAAGASYEFQLHTNCLNGHTSDWTPLDTFTTLTSKYLSERNLNAINLYPNPADDFLTVGFGLKEDEELTVTIYNVAGKILLTTSQSFSAGEQSIRLDVSKLPSAFYFAEVKSGDYMKTMKFVKE